MEEETTLSADKSEDGEDEKWGSFDTKIHDAMSPMIKKFLVDYFGDQLYDLESDTYREIDEIIRKEFVFSDRIADDLNNYRTIKDDELWQEAFNNFNPKDAKFGWQKLSYWEENGYLNEKDFLIINREPERTEEQKKELEKIRCANIIFDVHDRFTEYMQQGRDLIMPDIQKYIEDTASFDLTILPPVGYKELQYDLEDIVGNLFDRLYMIIEKEEEE